MLLGFAGMFYSADAQTIVGADMETWKSYTSILTPLTRPDGWFTSDSLYSILKLAAGKSYTGRVTKSTSVKHGGTASAKLVTSTDSLPSIMTNAKYTIDLGTGELTYSGGTNVTKRINFVNAWTQYTLPGSDSGYLVVEAYKNGIGAGGADSLVGYGEMPIIKSAGFKNTSAEVEYDNATVVPDRIIVLFITNNSDVPAAGTELYVDDITFTDVTGIETPIFNDADINVFPNPAVNNLQVKTSLNQKMILNLYASNGQLVATHLFQKNADIAVSTLASGTYIYVISGVDGHKYYSSTFVKQ